jgi:putative transposase
LTKTIVGLHEKWHHLNRNEWHHQTEIRRDLGISQGAFYKWKQKYGGMEASDVKRLKDLELENSRLKRLLADTILDKEILKDVIEKKGWGPTSGGSSSR